MGLCLLLALWGHGALAAQVTLPGAPPPAGAKLPRMKNPPPAMPAGVAGTRYMLAAGDATPAERESSGETSWRLRVREAVAVPGRTVTLGDIADPLGAMPPDEWRALAAQELWPAPDEAGKPMQINKARLAQALREVLGGISERCIIPNSLIIQRGGLVLREDELHALVVKSLTEPMNALPGVAELQDLRLPSHIFLAHARQQVTLEPVKAVPGRLSLRFAVQEMDGSVLRRVAATAFLNLWMEVPCAAKPLNKGDALTPDGITFTRMNAARMREIPWDGRGGPWQVLRSIGVGQPLFQGDLAALSAVRKGGIVSLVYEKGNVRMSVQAEILADAEPGAVVAVRNLQSRKQVFAVVRDNGTVVAK
jgi:flagella basal body P-ring formation protein FlgA